jgi:hypothetical protein
MDALAARCAEMPTTTLVTALTVLATNDKPTAEERLVRARIIDTLENRYPAASQAVQDAFDEAAAIEEETGQYVDVDYVEILTAAIAAAR